jgi:hypothetical protein
MGTEPTYNNAYAHANPPDAFGSLTAVCSNYDKRDNTRTDEAGDDGGISGNRYQHSTLFPHGLRAVGTLESLTGTHSVLSASSDACHTTADNHHPKHSFHGTSMRSSGQEYTLRRLTFTFMAFRWMGLPYQDEEEGRKDDANFPAEAIDAETEEDHTEDITHQDRV